MATINQFLNKYAKGKNKNKTKNKAIHLEKNPQKRGICLKVYIMSPRKPNSAQRKVARVKLKNNNEIIAYIPGEGHNLQEHSTVLIHGGRVKDLTGIKYKVIRGVYDTQPVFNRKQGRSKYGTKKTL